MPFGLPAQPWLHSMIFEHTCVFIVCLITWAYNLGAHNKSQAFVFIFTVHGCVNRGSSGITAPSSSTSPDPKCEKSRRLHLAAISGNVVIR